MEPENKSQEKERSFWIPWFSGSMSNFGGVDGMGWDEIIALFSPAHHSDNPPPIPPHLSAFLPPLYGGVIQGINQIDRPSQMFLKILKSKKEKTQNPSSLHEGLTSFYEIDRCISNWWHTIPRPFNKVEDLREGIAKSGGPPALFQQLLCGDKELQEGTTSLCCSGGKNHQGGVGGWCFWVGVCKVLQRE